MIKKIKSESIAAIVKNSTLFIQNGALFLKALFLLSEI